MSAGKFLGGANTRRCLWLLTKWCVGGGGQGRRPQESARFSPATGSSIPLKKELSFRPHWRGRKVTCHALGCWQLARVRHGCGGPCQICTQSADIGSPRPCEMQVHRPREGGGWYHRSDSRVGPPSPEGPTGGRAGLG